MNKVDLLRQTLAAARQQEIPDTPQWEVVVVNDGSTDGTADFLLGEQGSGWSNPSLKVVTPQCNVGRAKARNLGAMAATGQYLLFIDDDIVAPSNLVASHLNILKDNPHCGTIGYAVTDPKLIDGPHFHYLDTRGVARLATGTDTSQAPGRFFVTQNAAVPRQAFLGIGGFDENFSAYGFEDMEVAFRLEDDAGIHFMTLAGPVPVHVHHHTLAQYWDKKVECGRSSLAMIAKLHPCRITEMSLHHVVDYEGQGKLSFLSQFIRWFARSSFGHKFPYLLRLWPTQKDFRPLFPGFYYRLMNLAVLCCFRQGLNESQKG